MTKIMGYASTSSLHDLKPMQIDRREPVSNDVEIKILFCGVCHSDIHQVKNEWKNTVYPCMPGHEIVGRVTTVGPAVKKYKAGDLVGVGCMIDSCHSCPACLEGLEQYCEKGFLGTYNGNQRTPTKDNLTFGGYSESIVVREDFVLRIPENLDPASAAPLLCAGVTTFSPLRHWNVGPGKEVAIIGLGGLGQMAIKLATALGATVTAITTSAEKADDAVSYGAKNVIVSTDKEQMKKHMNAFHFILSTIPQPHDVNPYITLVKRDGVITVVGCIAPLKKPIDLSKMVIDRKSLGTSLIGGIAETQEVLDFCSEHHITSQTQVIDIDEINDAFKKVNEGEVDFRYVIDMATLKGKKEEPTLLEKVGL